MAADLNEKFALQYLESEPCDAFPVSYSHAQMLKFSLSLNKDIYEQYMHGFSQDILEANPAWFLEMLSCAAAYSLVFDYQRQHGKIGVPIIHPADSPESRQNTTYRFYLDVQNDFLKVKTPEEIRQDLGKKIEKILDRYPDRFQLTHDFDTFAMYFEQFKTNALFNL
jgi:hypothetical protein